MHVRTVSHTRGHVFVVMLSYVIIAELALSAELQADSPSTTIPPAAARSCAGHPA